MDYDTAFSTVSNLRGSLQAEKGEGYLLTASDIKQMYETYVNYSIAAQVKDALSETLGKTIADRWIFYCFKRKPEEARLYQIRNDINHGNIRENRLDQYTKVFVSGAILQTLVSDLLYKKIRKVTNITKDVDEYVRRVTIAFKQADGDLTDVEDW